MSTRSTIAVVISQLDRGKFIEPDLSLLGKRIESDLKEPEFHRTVLNEGTEVVAIYHHWDGYPEGVGQTLLDEFNEYEKAKNLVSFGDASTINGDTATFYNSWRAGEPWEFTQPKQYDSEDDFNEKFNDDVFIEYLYLFKDGEWFVKSQFADNPEWMPLASVLSAE